MARRLGPALRWWMVASLVWLGGCALQLKRPELDLSDGTPLRPAQHPSRIAAVLRMAHHQTARLVEAQLPPMANGAEQWGPLRASWRIQRQGELQVSSDERRRLCFDAPFVGTGTLHSFGQSLERELKLQLQACVRPVIDGHGAVRLADAEAKVTVQRDSVSGPMAMLRDAVLGKLQTMASDQVARKLQEASLPLAGTLRPLQALLARPIAVDEGTCLKLRAQRLDVAQPQVDPTALRFGASLAALPTVERPCVATPQADWAAPTHALTPQIVGNLESTATELLLPIGVSIATLEPHVQQAVDQLGKVETKNGWWQVGRVRLATSKGRLVVRAEVTGEVADTVLFVPVRRAVRGEMLLWGTPRLGPAGIDLPDLEIDFSSGDRWVDAVAALKRSELADTIRRKLTVPQARIDADVRKALAQLGRHLDVGGEQLPVVVQTDEISLREVAARGQRLEVMVHFRGQVVLGDRATK